jgi:uncharacterized protein YdaT
LKEITNIYIEEIYVDQRIIGIEKNKCKVPRKNMVKEQTKKFALSLSLSLSLSEI